MRRMLTGRADDLSLDLAEHSAEGDTGTAHWIARYTFGRTGREVTNDIRARFRFSDGLIAEHDDQFSFWRWARQALGPAGLAFGWAPPMRAAVRKRAREDLARFRNEG